MNSIIVPAYNAEQVLGACLDALLPQLGHADELMVVDDGSTDQTSAIARSRGVRVCQQPNRGAGAARNTGAEQARGEVVLFIDADSVPAVDWLAKMSAPFADAAIAGVSGEKKTRQANLLARLVQTEYDFKYDRIAAFDRIDFVDSSTAAYRRDLFIANGGFDATLMEAEDVDLSFRLAERGYKMILARDAITWHTHPESLGEFLRRKYRYALWRSAVYARFPRKAASDTRTPQTQKMQVALAFLLIPVLLASMFWKTLTLVLIFLLMVFTATTLPLIWRCWQTSKRLALVAPAILLLEAYAGGAGALLGLLKQRTR